jgi:putative transposase
MQLIENRLYHFYNQGNNHMNIFFNRGNYLYFLQKFQKYVFPYCKVLAYCLMPNHFHFLLYITNDSTKEKKVGGISMAVLIDGFRLLLSTYAQGINEQEKRSGSLFRQKTKAKILNDVNMDYSTICFHYIHQNPYHKGLVKKMEDWEFSSFRDYMGIRDKSLCEKVLAFELLDISKEDFYEHSYHVIAQEKIDLLY